MEASLTLRDGSAVRVRRVSMDDAPRVQAFVRSLSADARHDRFFSAVSELSPPTLRRVLSSPGLSVAALHGERFVALAQYASESGEAEFAVVVADGWRGNGLGEALLGLLLDHARSTAVKAVKGLALADNRPMRLLASKLGFAFRRDEDPQLVRMALELS